MKLILAISAGQSLYKKEVNPLQRHSRYLNYGLLGLVTMLHDKGNLPIHMFQGEGTPQEMLYTIKKEGIQLDRDCQCVLLSIPSSYSVTWSQIFCKLLREESNLPIVVGGRWVVDGQREWVLERIPQVTHIIEGFGERHLAKFFDIPDADLIPEGNTTCFEYFDYTLLHNYQEYQPSIEISRGCGCGCQFCLDRYNLRLPNKSVSVIMKEFDQLDKLYSTYSVYLEAPNFYFEPRWVDEYHNTVSSRSVIIPWRCTTRVESVPLAQLKKLSESGLKIIDVGLESASHSQLLRMGKTKQPTVYLEQAERLLVECNKHGILVKLNILLYAGENEKTIGETMQWLKDRREIIHGVSVGSIVYYKGMGNFDELTRFGASIVCGEDLECHGYANLNPSPTLSFKQSQNLCIQISKSVMTHQEYFDLKSHSYFERGYDYSDFVRDIATCDPKRLPFAVKGIDI